MRCLAWRSRYCRAAPSFDGDERGKCKHDDAEHQRKEAGPRQVETAEIEQRGLPDEDEPDPIIDGKIDLGALAAEFFALGLDPYPRKPGATFEESTESEPADSPFSALAKRAKPDSD